MDPFVPFRTLIHQIHVDHQETMTHSLHLLITTVLQNDSANE
jgi:hypothetical protein